MMNLRRVNILLLIILTYAIIYFNSLNNPFIWDDIPLIVENAYIKNIVNLFKIFSSDFFYFSFEKGNYYRPIQTLTYMFDYSFWRLNPLGYHITNIFLHFFVTFLIFLILELITNNKRLSLISSAFFLVHPIHSEAVTYISGRADLLVALFILISLLFYIKYRTLTKIKYFILSLFSFIFALLTKEIAIILPFLIILYDLYFGIDKRKNKSIKSIFRPYAIYFLILGLYVFLRTTILNFITGPTLNIQADFVLRLMTSIKSLMIYIGLILFPFSLHMERQLPVLESIWNFTAVFSTACLFIIILFIIRFFKRQKLISFGSAWFLLTLVPTMGIFMPGKNITMAEHWLYLPSIGFFIILGVVFDNLIKINKEISIIILSSLLFFYSYLTIRQNTTWKDPLNFYQRIISYTPNSAKAHFNLGLIYQKNKDYDKAIDEYKRSLEIGQNYFLAHNNIGNIYFFRGMYDMAIKEYRRSIEMEPGYFLTYNNLGNLYALMKEHDKAIEEYQKSASLNPYYSESHNNLGLVYLEKDDYQKAENEFRQALKLNPENAEAYNNLGNLYAKKELYNEAIIHYKQTIKLKPDFEKAHFNLGIVYFKKNLIEQARIEWEKVLEINPIHEGALKNLELLRSFEE